VARSTGLDRGVRWAAAAQLTKVNAPEGGQSAKAVVGPGLGITLSATNRNPKVQNIEVIELTRKMVEAQRYVEDISGVVLRSPKVHVRIDDGRNFMAMSDRTFDMITADPIHPRNTGVATFIPRNSTAFSDLALQMCLCMASST
jgi:predicted membrane-bound spermidine synthase